MVHTEHGPDTTIGEGANVVLALAGQVNVSALRAKSQGVNPVILHLSLGRKAHSTAEGCRGELPLRGALLRVVVWAALFVLAATVFFVMGLIAGSGV